MGPKPGRRRVGKTFLIRYGRVPVADWYFELTGQRDGKQRAQLEHFAKALSQSFHNGLVLQAPATWELAFSELEKSIRSLPADGKPVTVFFDEAPWLDSRRSGFLGALEYFWNAQGTRIPRLKMFICGSAAYWIVHKIVHGKGGWHRRVTELVRVQQFKLHEVATYLAHQNIGLSRTDILKLYMVLGGVPYYLALMRRGESIAAFVEFHAPLGVRGERHWCYRPCDMFTLFHLQWLARRSSTRSWHAIVNSQQYKSWCGHAFEIVAWNHAHSIARALGIAKSDYTTTRPDLENSAGKAQVDLLFDVRGGAVYLFELKFCDGLFVMTRTEAEKLRLRKEVLNAHFKGRRSIIVCLLAPEGVRSNEHSKAAVDLILDADVLFRDGES